MPSKRFCRIFDGLSIKSCMLMLTVLGIVVLIASCASFEHLTEVTEDTFPQAAQCGKCHVEIYKEWLQSDHSAAYTNPHFRRATDNYSFEKCLSCQAQSNRQVRCRRTWLWHFRPCDNACSGGIGRMDDSPGVFRTCRRVPDAAHVPGPDKPTDTRGLAGCIHRICFCRICTPASSTMDRGL